MGRVAAVVLAVALGGVIAAPAQAAKSTGRCGHGARVAGDVVLIVTKSRSYGCLRTRGRRFKLGDRRDDLPPGKLGAYTATGTLLAYSIEWAWKHAAWSELRVMDLRTGAILHRLDRVETPNSRDGCPAADEWNGTEVVAVALAPDGRVAWIQRDMSESPSPPSDPYSGYSDLCQYEVQVLGAGVVDASRDIDPSYLKIRDGAVRWFDRDALLTAPLP